MREILRAGVVTAVTGGVMIFAAQPTETPTVQPVVEVQSCTDDFPVSSVLEGADFADLPSIDPNAYVPFTDKVKQVGTISLQGHNVVVDAPVLPEVYREALRSAAQTPFVACTLQERIGKIDVKVGTEGEGAFYQSIARSADLAGAKQADEMRIILGGDGTKVLEDGSLAVRIFKKAGSIKEALVHESAHAHLEEVVRRAREGDETAAALVDKLSRSYQDEMKMVAENNREQLGNTAVPWLQELKTQFAAAGFHAEAEATRRVIDAFETPHGLDNLIVNCWSLETAQCNLQSPANMVYRLATESGTDLTDEAKAIVGQHRQAKELALSNAWENILEQPTQFPVTDESSALPELMPYAGDPYFSPNEANASRIGISTMQSMADTVRAIRALPPERRQLEIQQYRTLVKIYKNYFPGDLAALQIDEIAAQL